MIQIGEWKYCTYHNLSQTAQLFLAKYTPLVNAIRSQWPRTEVDILPIVMSRTGTPQSSTITSLTALLTLRTDPPYKLISKARLDTSRILAQLHTHIV
jgi:catalase (peroxidase I)